MQIRAAAMNVNIAGTTPDRNMQGNGRQARPVNGLFGASCRVTISQEGRRLSERQADRTENNSGSVRAEKMLLRQQEMSEQYKSAREGYREELKNLEAEMNSRNNSYDKEADRETIEKEQEVLKAMRSQKQAQMEENERLTKEAQRMAMQFSKYQGEIDKNNRDLLTLLKSIEETEKTKDELENGKAEDDHGSGASGGGDSVGDAIQGSAVQFTVSSVKREWNVQEMIIGLSDEGHRLLDHAADVTRNILKESEKIRTALDEGALTDDAAEMIEHLRDGLEMDYQDVELSRSHGLHMMQAAQEDKIRHIADDPLKGMSEAKKSIMRSAADAVCNEAMQGRLEESSRELRDEVDRLIDRRNHADGFRPDEEEQEDEEELKTKAASETGI